ncbi:MAG TPA: hypothetical protein GXX23_01365 [Firmicutes bacterium]|nr:hypothetical protein [Candidatus Fermentithermobacillaceae bacterium]
MSYAPEARCGKWFDRGVDTKDYSVRMWEKLGFPRVLEEPLPKNYKGRFQYHYRLTRQEYGERRTGSSSI